MNLETSGEHLYATHAETIEAVIAAVCRRHRLTADHADELASLVRLKLVEHDSDVLRRFEGRSSVRTYLITVAERVLLDWRAKQWGKWRPCEEARRLGPVAVALDRLLTRDGLAYEEAVEQLVAQGVADSRASLDAMRPKLAVRSGRWMVGSDVLEQMPSGGALPDETVAARERHQQMSTAAAALRATLRTLAPQEQLMLRLRFQDGFTVARIAVLLGEEQKPLYRRFERLFAQMREALVSRGVGAEVLAELFGEAGAEFSPVLSAIPAGNEGWRPSTQSRPGGPHA